MAGAAGADPAELGLHPLAIAVGEAWVSELVHSLRSEDREIIGAWPGTMTEARGRILASVRTELGTELLHQLARIANLTARRSWEGLSHPDPER